MLSVNENNLFRQKRATEWRRSFLTDRLKSLAITLYEFKTLQLRTNNDLSVLEKYDNNIGSRESFFFNLAKPNFFWKYGYFHGEISLEQFFFIFLIYNHFS